MEVSSIRKWLIDNICEEWFFEDEAYLSEIIGVDAVRRLIQEGTGTYRIRSIFKHKDYIKAKIKEWLESGKSISIKEWCEALDCGVSSFYELLKQIYENDLFLEKYNRKFEKKRRENESK